jgi:hypothetical protein
MEKKRIVVLSLSTIAALGMIGSIAFIGVNSALADDSSSGYPQIVKNIASKFGLSEAEVQTVFEDTRKQRMSDELDQAVTDGKITADQKALIVARQEEMKTKMDEIKNKSLTDEERKAAVKALMDEQKAWMESNNIPQGVMRGGPGGGHGPREGMGIRGGRAEM